MSETHNANIDVVQRKSTRNPTRPTDATRTQANYQRKSCGNCGSFHRPRSCPANGNQCDNCSRLGHFSKCCRFTQRHETRHNQKRVYNVDHEQTYASDNECDRGIDYITIHSVDGHKSKNTEHYSTLKIGSKNQTGYRHRNRRINK